MSFIFGLDLGQSGDPTAIAIAEAVGEKRAPVWLENPYPTQAELDAARGTSEPRGMLHLRHMERIKLGTPYPAIVKRVASMLGGAPLKGQTELVVDSTGVGRPVIDMMRDAGLDPVAITITGGSETTGEGRAFRVPKRELVVGLQVLMQDGRLKIASSVPDAVTLMQELLTFKVKVDPVTAHDTYNAREGAHDDLVLAAAMAAWWARRSTGFWWV